MEINENKAIAVITLRIAPKISRVFLLYLSASNPVNMENIGRGTLFIKKNIPKWYGELLVISSNIHINTNNSILRPISVIMPKYQIVLNLERINTSNRGELESFCNSSLAMEMGYRMYNVHSITNMAHMALSL